MNSTKIIRFNLVIVYLIVALVFGLNLSGKLFSETFIAVVNQHAYYLTPHWSFYLIGLIGFLGVGYGIITYLNQAHKGGTPYSVMFERRVIGLLLQIFLLASLWLVILCQGQFLVSMIISLVMTRSASKLIYNVSRSPDLRYNNWVLRNWVGILTAWLYALAFINVAVYLTSVGLSGTGWGAVVWGLIIVVAMVYISVNMHIKYGNEYITYAMTWIVFTIAVNHWPSSSFPYQNTPMFIGLILLFFFGRSGFQLLESARKEQADN